MDLRCLLPLTRVANAVCGLAVLGLVLFQAAAPVVLWQRNPDHGLADYALNRDRSVDVVHQRGYPEGFTYPLPGVLARVALDQLGEPWSAYAWALTSAVASIASLAMIQRLLNLNESPHRHLLALLSLLAAQYYVGWDLNALNCNLMYLALVCGMLVTLDRRPLLAGGLLAASIGLKLYSVVFLPYLLCRGERKCLGAAVLMIVVLFFVLPLPTFGVRGTMDVNGDWLHELLATSSPRFPLDFQAYVIAPQKILHLTLTSNSLATSRGWLDLSFNQVQAVAHILKTCWLVLIGGAFFLGHTLARSGRQGREVLAMDGSLLMLATLPISPLLQPHHCVVVLLPTMMFLKDAFDAGVAPRLRFMLGLVVVGGVLLMEIGPSGDLRGIGTSVQFHLLLAGAYAWLWNRRHVRAAPSSTRYVGAKEQVPDAAPVGRVLAA